MRGTIEVQDKSPFDRALIEINEETSLSPNDIILIRTSKPIFVRAEDINTIWKIHPFLFRLVSKDLKNKIRIDWEHEKFQWIKPNELNDFNKTVPNLKDTFYRVYLPIDVHQGILNIRHDKKSGAQQLANKALDIFYQMIKTKSYDNGNIKDYKGFLLTLLNVGWHLVQARPSMKASISYVVTTLLKQVLKILDKYRIVELKTKFKESDQKIIEHFMDILSSNIQIQNQILHIMTISYSSTIYSILLNLIQKFANESTNKLIITVLESRPLNEDSSCCYFMSDVTCALIGADEINGDNGNVTNKIGSLPLAIAAKSHNKSVYVISKSDKIIGSYNEIIKSYDDVEEWKRIIQQNGNLFKVRNVYFEKINFGYIDGYVTELDSTLLRVQDIKKLWDDRKLDGQIFGILESESDAELKELCIKDSEYYGVAVAKKISDNILGNN
ncbi:2471_t:CDS:2 [Entrophospora sp. SA101]|nr:1139_t:CDS:2 [Entrophospora sp. SA101]CAJ0769315.1 2471_t:CDS:2 [Entrophospora sp. SA101]